MKKKKETRSSKYQYIFNEIPMESRDTDNPVHLTDKQEHSDDWSELQDQITELVWSLIDTECTPTQIKRLKLVKDGYTQDEMAKKEGINQSSIVKTIAGNKFYDSGTVKEYGGA